MSEPIQERKFLGAERYRKGGSEFYSCPRCGGLTVVIGHSYLVTDMGEDVVGQYVNTAKCEYCKSVFAVVYRVPVEDS